MFRRFDFQKFSPLAVGFILFAVLVGIGLCIPSDKGIAPKPEPDPPPISNRMADLAEGGARDYLEAMAANAVKIAKCVALKKCDSETAYERLKSMNEQARDEAYRKMNRAFDAADDAGHLEAALQQAAQGFQRAASKLSPMKLELELELEIEDEPIEFGEPINDEENDPAPPAPKPAVNVQREARIARGLPIRD